MGASVSLKMFRKKEGDDQADPSPGADQDLKGKAGYDADPDKAQPFFRHAQTTHDTSNYAYAMVLWLKGIRLDPTSLEALEKFYLSALSFNENEGKGKGPTKEQTSQFEGKTPIDRYVAALLQWGGWRFDWDAGIKAMEAAVKLDLGEQAYWIGTRALAGALNDPKAKKAAYVKLLDLFEEIGAYDKAVLAGDTAVRMDNRDAKLEYRVKNMSAQATMHRGGFADAGTAGGFRKMVKDSEAQRALLEEDSLVKSQSTLEGLIERYRAAYRDQPDDLPTVQKYVKFLTERGTPEDEKTAYSVLMKTFEKTHQYQFKKEAGDVKMRVGRRKLRGLRDAAAADPGDPSKQQEFERFAKGLLDLEIAEYVERVRNYPTDLQLKYELGRRHFEAGQYEQAIQQFQIAQNAAGIARKVQNDLGQAFLRLGWFAEAEDTMRGAIAGHPSESDDLGLQLRYGLMTVLQQKAEQDRDLAAAEEAFKIASKIAINQIDYRDIRERRAALQELVKKLKDAA